MSTMEETSGQGLATVDAAIAERYAQFEIEPYESTLLKEAMQNKEMSMEARIALTFADAEQ